MNDARQGFRQRPPLPVTPSGRERGTRELPTSGQGNSLNRNHGQDSVRRRSWLKTALGAVLCGSPAILGGAGRTPGDKPNLLFLWTDEQRADTLAVYGTLEASGQAGNTLVVFTSDHGEMMGSHSLIGKQVLYEESIRVPLLIHVPFRHITPGPDRATGQPHRSGSHAFGDDGLQEPALPAGSKPVAAAAGGSGSLKTMSLSNGTPPPRWSRPW